MGKKWTLVAASCLLLASLTACSSNNVEAEPTMEAASVEWTEAEASKIEKKAADLDSRTTKLQKEVAALLGEKPPTDGDNETPPPSDTIFSDVGLNYWAYKEIMSLYNAKLISGYADQGKFLPGNSITRAQAAAMLVKALNLPLLDSPSEFSDVRDNNWARKAIMTVVDKGYFNGSDGKFMPNAPMKRKHMAVVLQRAFELKPIDAPYEEYTDVPETNDGYFSIKAVSQNGIANGSNGQFRPSEPTTRAQFSVFLYRALDQ